MQIKNAVLALLGAAALAEASVLPDRRQAKGGRFGQNIGQNNNNNNNNNAQAGNDATNTCLAANAVQTGSASTGQESGATAGQSPSVISNNNFINFCSGKTLTNGLQNTGGSCNGIVMGDIPARNKMISSMLINPAHNDDIAPNQSFDVQVQINNLAAGTFTNPDSTYYSAPQQLNNQGLVIGHTHVVIQNMGNTLTPAKPLDAGTFAFFKGINDAGNGNGLLSATVTGGLPAGNYRVCTMSGASNHQSPIMPVAQRGAQEDCNKFTVGGGAGNGNKQQQGNGGSPGNADQKDPGADENQENSGAGPRLSDPPGGNGGATAANAIGGIVAPPVNDSGDSNRPFSVNGNTFVTKDAAVQRACDIQNNACSDAVNRAQLNGVALADCRAQMPTCVADLS